MRVTCCLVPLKTGNSQVSWMEFVSVPGRVGARHLSQSYTRKYLAGVEIPQKTMEMGVGFLFRPFIIRVTISTDLYFVRCRFQKRQRLDLMTVQTRTREVGT
jgi:hypothetical protein